VRRISAEPYWDGFSHGRRIILNTRDYRLMRAVVTAAETWGNSTRWVDGVEICRALDAFNNGGKRDPSRAMRGEESK
jgi:hypothetical protein